jgi:Ca2+-binding EF-hand superfamily protein
MITTMRWFAVLLCVLLVGACGSHQTTAECSRFLAGMRAAFERYDTNGDGRISPQEYRDVINNLVGRRVGQSAADDNPEQTDRDFDNLDRNRDRYLTFDEFTGNVCENGYYEQQQPAHSKE